MPQVVVGAALAGGFSAATGATIGTLTVMQTAFVVAGVSAATGLVTQAMAPEPPSFEGGIPDFKVEARDRVQTARSTSEEKTLILGQAQVGGPLCAFESTGTDNEFLHIAQLHAAHPCDAFVSFFLNDEEVGARDGSGNVTSGRFDGQARIIGHLGAFDQAADSDMVSEIGGWTSDDKGGGVTYSYVRVEWDQDTWPNGFSGHKAVIRGMHAYDPRVTPATIDTSTAASPAVFTTTAAHGLAAEDYVWIKDHLDAVPTVTKMYQVATAPTTTTFTLIDEDGGSVDLSAGGTGGSVYKMAWTDNWELLVRMYLCHRATFNAQNKEFDDTQIAAEANKCDEQVALTSDAISFSADAGTDTLTLNQSKRWRLGDGCTVSTTGTLPAGLVAATTYYLIRDSATEVKLAASLEDARAGTPIDITDTGSGVHTITRNSQLRYTCNGVIKLGANPVDPLEELMTAAAGVVVDDEGIFKIYCGAATTASGTSDETDLRDAELAPEPHLPFAEAFNAARGTYVDPDQFYTYIDAPPWKNQNYVDDDGELIFRDFRLAFTDNPTAAQRLFKIAVERARQGATVVWRGKPRKFPTAVWDVESVSVDILGWASKEFRVLSSRERPDFGINLVYREEDSAVWDWNLGDETDLADAPSSALPDPFTVANPTGLGVSTQTVVDETGSEVHRAELSWTAPADQYVTSGGQIEVRFKKGGAADYEPSFEVAGHKVKASTPPLEFGATYELGIRSRNNLGQRQKPEAWVTVTDFIVGASAAGVDATRDYGLVADVEDLEFKRGGIGETADKTFDWGTIT